MLMKNVLSGKLEPKKLITHHFKLGDILEAYKVFGNASEEKALKVIVTPEPVGTPQVAAINKKETVPA